MVVAAIVGVSYGQARDAHSPAPRTTARSCFGAAARDAVHPCRDPALKYEVVPTPREARNRQNAPCTIIEEKGPLRVCEFGAPAASASAAVGLLGDSHAAHWRAALEVVAHAKRWLVLSITLSGCPFSTITRVLPEPLLSRCTERNREVPQWFTRHPEVNTVFVSELSGATWIVPRGANMFDAQVRGYLDAWRQLPDTVRHIVVIRDTPKDLPGTQRCIQRAMARHEAAGIACSVPRARAIDRDAAVAAARLAAPRVQVVDLNRYFCDSRRCYPVIGGALVHKDEHHLTAVFVTTLGPYLLNAVNALGPLG